MSKTSFNISKQTVYVNNINNDYIAIEKKLFLIIRSNQLEGLNSSLQFIASSDRIQSLITRTKQVLTGEIERFYFPEEDVPLCVIVNKDMVIEDHDLESIPTTDFLAVLEVYLKEMEEFERTQKTEKELE